MILFELCVLKQTRTSVNWKLWALLKLFALIYCVGYILFLCAVAQEMSLWVCINVNKLKKIKTKVFWDNVILLKLIS